jgi:hypothetical protein
LLVYQGWGDQFNGQTLPITYRQQVIDLLAGKAHGARAEHQVDGFMRVFMVPGMAHCIGGPGLTDFDALSAVQAWVEAGDAPDQLLASGQASGKPAVRPICAYPKSAHYAGSGSPDDAASFKCVMAKNAAKGNAS